LVSVADVGVPRIGVTSVGEVDKTTLPVPVLVVTPVPPEATARVVDKPAAVPVVFWLKVGQVNVPVLKLPDCGVPKIGVTSVGEVDNTLLPEPVLVVTPVPPLATASVPAKVIVPEAVTGPPEVVKPVVPPDTLTDVTVPVPVTVDQVGAPVPLLIST
jgi:hypothetical protein